MRLIKILLLMALLAFSAFAQADTQMLEACYAKFSRLEVSEQPPLRIHLSGQILHSALVVSGMQVEKEGDSLTILVSLSLVSSLPWNKNQRSDFSYDLEIPAAINTVFFGRENS